jgi:hypothetical protein
MSESKKNKETRRSGLANLKIRLWQLIIPVCLTVICLAVMLIAVSQPQQIKARTTLVSWEHSGTFDYSAYLKPSYLFGSKALETPTPEPAPTPGITRTQLSPMKYPAESVAGFHFTLNYIFNSSQALQSISSTCRVTAQGTDVEGKNQEIELLALTPSEGPKFTFDFDLPMSEKLSKGNVTIYALVYPVVNLTSGPLYESFLQQFTIRRESGMLVIDREPGSTVNGYLGSLSYSQTSLVSYQVLLKGSQGNMNITAVPPSAEPPTLPAPTPVVQKLTRVGPAGPIFIKLLDRIDASFKYDLASSKPITNLTKTAGIEAELKAGNVWSKIVMLVPPTPAEAIIPFTIDYPALSKMIDTIREETGASSENYSIAIRAVVKVSGQTPNGDILDTFTQTLTGKNEGGRLTWVEPLQQTKTGKIETETIVDNNPGLLGLSSSAITQLLIPLAFVFLAVFVFLFIIYRKNSRMATSTVEKQIRQYEKKYGDRITEASGGAFPVSGSSIEVDSIDSLIKIAEEVEKPVMHQIDKSNLPQIHHYIVYDVNVNYVYIVKEFEPAE